LSVREDCCKFIFLVQLVLMVAQVLAIIWIIGIMGILLLKPGKTKRLIHTFVHPYLYFLTKPLVLAVITFHPGSY